MTASPSAPTTYVAWLGSARGDGDDGQGAGHDGAIGGKGAGLDRLARSGFEIPPGFCLTTTAFEVHETALAADPGYQAALAALPDEAARIAVVTAVRDAPMPTAVAEELAIALETLRERGRTNLAVRSSAVGEDGAEASYAGLHETELGLAPEDVPAAVGRCWASLWSGSAVAYRVRRGLPLDGPVMAVLVQALVPADASAVVFTRHPVTGRTDQLLINALSGLGEPMVSGTATPDTIVVDKATRTVIETVPGDGGERLLATEGGVIRSIDGSGAPALDDDALDSLVGLAIQVETAFGAPVDIEAAHAEGRWFLLQARPITT
jgi:rifampicin phosphotransferase